MKNRREKKKNEWKTEKERRIEHWLRWMNMSLLEHRVSYRQLVRAKCDSRKRHRACSFHHRASPSNTIIHSIGRVVGRQSFARAHSPCDLMRISYGFIHFYGCGVARLLRFVSPPRATIMVICASVVRRSSRPVMFLFFFLLLLIFYSAAGAAISSHRFKYTNRPCFVLLSNK